MHSDMYSLDYYEIMYLFVWINKKLWKELGKLEIKDISLIFWDYFLVLKEIP